MSGLPVLQALLDDGTGTYPTDVSSVTALETGVTCDRGRQDELSENQAGTLKLTLENIAGALTPGVGTSLDQGVRLRYTYPPAAHLNVIPAASARFAGTVGSWGTANGATIATSALHVASDANNAAVGGTSVLITWPTGGIPAAQLNLAGLTIGTVYAFSTYVYIPSGSDDLKLQVFGVGSGANVTTRDTVTRVSLTFTASATSHFVQLVGLATTTGHQAWFSCPMVNAGTVAGEFNTLTSTAYTRWTGRLQSLPVSWPGGGDEFSVIAATAIDALATMARCTLQSASDMTIMNEILGETNKGSFHPISEPSGASRAHDALHLQPALIRQVAGGGSVAFGTSLGTPDGATGATLTKVAGFTQGQLIATSSASANSMRTNFVINAPAGGLGAATDVQLWALVDPITGGTLVSISLTGLGVLTFHGSSVISVTVPNFSAGTPHVIGAVITGVGVKLWADGALLATGGGSLVSAGLSIALGDPVNAFSCTIGKLVTGGILTDPNMAAEQNAMLFDFLGETPVQRITRLCGYAGVATGTLDATSTTLLGYAQQDGRSALECLLEVAQADIGNAYADSAGAISYVGGLTAMARAVADATIDANFTDVGTSVLTDMVGVVNDATGTTPVTQNVYRTYDLASSGPPGNHGVYPQSYTWNVSTDDQAQDRTDWKLNNYSDPHSRVGTLILDLLTMDPTSVAAALALDLTHYLRVTGMPSQTPGGTTLDLVVEGVSESQWLTASDAGWTLTLNVVSRALVGAWVLDDPVWSVLDSTTKLGV